MGLLDLDRRVVIHFKSPNLRVALELSSRVKPALSEALESEFFSIKVTTNRLAVFVTENKN